MVSFPLFHFWYDKVIVWVRFGVDGVLGYHMPNCCANQITGLASVRVVK